ncbi:hypothetical protein V6N11_082514 [Hibiscus sabdariffa]|uniref:Uncharacterized protein n=1 Tax=Hibiscus sabdariffa TaxID=183260 RepID=A0ABR2N8U3_9ROSI
MRIYWEIQRINEEVSDILVENQSNATENHSGCSCRPSAPCSLITRKIARRWLMLCIIDPLKRWRPFTV